MPLLTLEHISVAYGEQMILRDFNLQLDRGRFLSLLGASGCGKTTTLRVIGGFAEAREGRFMFNGKDYTCLPPHKRNFGFVFQSYALFPHLSVFDNVAFGLRQRHLKTPTIRSKVDRMLGIVGLAGFQTRLPNELSGGQRQRVAIARALVIEPELLLLDEPLSNLDANLRVAMRMEIRRIQQELGITTVYVSHDQEECFAISDVVAVMNKGVVEQIDEPARIFAHPATEFVARFVGFENFVSFQEWGARAGTIEARAGVHRFIIRTSRTYHGHETLKGAIRPDDVRIAPDTTNTEHSESNSHGFGILPNTLPGIVRIATYLGKRYQYSVATDLGDFNSIQESATPYSVGQRISLLFPEDAIVVF
jgi:putative spermidine/putrescine transport system ATP-binding protein